MAPGYCGQQRRRSSPGKQLPRRLGFGARRTSVFRRFQGSVRGGVWPGRELVARLIHRSGLRRAAEAAAASSAAEAVLRGGARRRTGVPATGTAYGLPKLAQRFRPLKLTEGSDQTGTARMEVGGVNQRRRWAEHGDEGDAGVRRARRVHLWRSCGANQGVRMA